MIALQTSLTAHYTLAAGDGVSPLCRQAVYLVPLHLIEDDATAATCPDCHREARRTGARVKVFYATS